MPDYEASLEKREIFWRHGLPGEFRDPDLTASARGLIPKKSLQCS